MTFEIGRTIESLKIEDDTLYIGFNYALGIKINDSGQNCCESRWMTCDDDLNEHTGNRLMGFELLPVQISNATDNSDCLEILFLRIITDKGSFRVCMHNQHNGYYGGFCPVITEWNKKK